MKTSNTDFQETGSLKEAVIHILPRDFSMLLTGIVAVACLVDFIQTGNVYMLLTAYAIAVGRVGLVPSLLSKKGATKED